MHVFTTIELIQDTSCIYPMISTDILCILHVLKKHVGLNYVIKKIIYVPFHL